MSRTHRDDRNRTPLGSMLLTGACCTGALAYAALVGPSMLPPQDTQTTSTVGNEQPQEEQAAEQPVEELDLQGPVGRLEVQVSDRDRAWVQTLTCTGDLDSDHAACAALAEAAVGFEGDSDSTVEVPELQEEAEEETEEDGEQQAPVGADAGESGIGPDETPGAEEQAGTEVLFTEVNEGAVCTDTVYGPQEATITGTWEGEEIDTSLSREGSCEEARWQRLRALTEDLA